MLEVRQDIRTEVWTEEPRKTDPCEEKSWPLRVDTVTYYSTYPANTQKAKLWEVTLRCNCCKWLQS